MDTERKPSATIQIFAMLLRKFSRFLLIFFFLGLGHKQNLFNSLPSWQQFFEFHRIFQPLPTHAELC